MNILNAGYSAELTLVANDVVTINPGASVVVEAVSGLGLSAGVIGTYTDGRTLGPYLAGVVKLTAVMGDCSYGVSTGVSAVTSTVNPLTGGLDLLGPNGVIHTDAAKPVNSGVALWSSAPTAALFAISGQSGAVVTSEQTADGGLRVSTVTADRYIDLVMVLPNPSVVRSCAIDMRATVGLNLISAYFGQDLAFTAATMISRSMNVSGSVETHRSGLRSQLWFSGAKSASWTNTGALDLDVSAFTHFRIRISPSAGQVADATIYGVRMNPVGRSRIAVISDDGYKTWLKYAAPILNRRGIPSTQAVIPSLVGVNANYCTLPMLRDFVIAGNECIAHGPNGGGGGTNLFTAYATDAERLADVVAARDYLLSNQLAGAQQAKCYAWPEGKFQSAGGDSGLMDLMIAAGFSLGRTVTRFLGFSADLLQDSPYSAMTVPIIGYVRQSTEGADTTELTDTTAAIEYCAQNGIDCIVMLHNVIPAQGVWAWTQSTDITVDKLVTIADKIVQCRKDYGQEPTLISRFAP